MRNITIISALLMFSLAACNKKPAEQPFVPDQVIPPSGTLPAGHPAINNNQGNGLTNMNGAFQSQKGTVVSAIDIPQFTYMEVKQDNQTRWLAATTVSVKKGDAIEFDSGTTLSNFTSKTLNRTFPSITFVNRVTVLKNN